MQLNFVYVSKKKSVMILLEILRATLQNSLPRQAPRICAMLTSDNNDKKMTSYTHQSDMDTLWYELVCVSLQHSVHR